MKGLVLAALAILFCTAELFSQACNPEWTEPGTGIDPDTIENLPMGYVGQPYDVTVQFKVPKVDSSVVSTGISVDHVELTGVTGLDLIPATLPFHYNCNPSSCSFKADSVGCVRLLGTPTAAGNYPLTINAKVYITPVVFLPVDFSGYHIEVSSSIGMASLSHDKFDVSQNTPNPINSKTTIYVNLPQPATIDWKISNILGSDVFKTTISGKRGLNTLVFDATKLAPGIYFYSVSDGKNSITKSMVVEKK